MSKHQVNRSVHFTLIAAMPLAALGFAMLYLLVRILLFIVADCFWYERALALLLLLAEIFILFQGIGYFFEIFAVEKRRRSLAVQAPLPSLTDYPPVAIIVSSFKEPLEVIEATLITFYNLTYSEKHIYFLDDTRYDLPGDDPVEMATYRRDVNDLCRRIGVNLFRRKWRGAKAGMINDFLDFTEGRTREGFEFQPNGGAQPTLDKSMNTSAKARASGMPCSVAAPM